MAQARSFAAGGSSRFGLIVAIGLALLTGLLVWAALRGNDSQPLVTSSTEGAETTVVTAREVIPARAEITRDMLQLTRVPASALLGGAFSDSSLVVGRIARIPIYPGEQLVQDKLASSRTDLGLSYIVPEGMRAMGVKVDKVISPGGLVRPGDRVDVVAVVDVEYTDIVSDKEFTETRSFTIAQNIQVLAVEQDLENQVPPVLDATTSSGEGSSTSDGASSEGSPVEQPEANPEGTVVTLSLTLQQTQDVLLAVDKGNIRLVVRAPGDNEIVELDDSTFLSLADPLFQELILEALRQRQ